MRPSRASNILSVYEFDNRIFTEFKCNFEFPAKAAAYQYQNSLYYSGGIKEKKKLKRGANEVPFPPKFKISIGKCKKAR